MSEFSVYKKCLASSVLAALFLIAAAPSPAAAAEPQEAEPSCVSELLDTANELLNILVGCSRAIKRLDDPQRSMLVRVVDNDGKPIAGAAILALVILSAENDSTANVDTFRWENLLWHIAITKTDGTARAVRSMSKDQTTCLLVKGKGHVPMGSYWSNQVRSSETPPFEYTFKLDRTQTIGGVVHDESGRPVAGATVTARLDGSEYNQGCVDIINTHREVKTDARGRWHCSSLPSRLEGLTIDVKRDEYVPLEIDEFACKRQAEELRAQKAAFVLAKGLVIQGSITDSQGRPVPSAQVMISQKDTPFHTGDTQLPTDTNGRYRFAQGKPGEVTISVAAAHLASQHRKIELAANSPPVDFRLKPGRTVKIRVVDSVGKPLADAAISPDEFPPFFGSRPNIVAKTSTTDKDGRWASDSEPEGEVPLAVQRAGCATVHRKFAAGDTEHRVVLTPPVCVSGRIIDAATRQPVERLRLSLNHTYLTKESTGVTYPSVDDNGKGRYELAFNDTQGVDAAAWRLCVQAPGYVTVVSRKFEMREGSQTIDIEMLPGPSVAGVVKRPDGTPVAGAKVFVSTTSEVVCVEDGRVSEGGYPPILMERTTADGRFELPMPLDPYVVGVVHESGGAEISAKDLESRGDIVLQPWARIEGSVQKPENPSPNTEESVKLTVNHVEDSSTLFKAAGDRPGIDWSYSYDLGPSRRFVFERVLPGRAEIEPSNTERMEGGGISCSLGDDAAGESASLWRTQHLTTAPGRTSHIEFVRKGRPVTGHAILPTGGSRKLATIGGSGVLVFQRPLVPVPPEIAKQPIDVRKKWEKQWLESEAGMAADRAAQDHSFDVAPDGAFKIENVAPGVYKLAVDLCRAGKSADEPGDDIAWFVQEVMIPAGATDKPLDLGKYTANAANLLRGDAAPDFEFQTADGRSHRLSEYRGKKVVVNFTEKWDSLEPWGMDAETNVTQTERDPKLIVNYYGPGPLVLINVSSDSGPRPTVKIAKSAEFQFIQGFVPPTAAVLNAYDVHRPRASVEAHIAQDGKVLRK